jgi:uncharacterized OB-fold protein
MIRPEYAKDVMPRMTAASSRFWEGCRNHELLFQRCSRCARAVFDPAYLCPWCLSSELNWEKSAGHGTIYSWSHVRRAPTVAFYSEYTVVIGKLAEGFYMLSNLVNVPNGMPLQKDLAISVTFVDFPEFSLPYFELTVAQQTRWDRTLLIS